MVNYRLDARLEGLAAGRFLRNPRTNSMAGRKEIGAAYSRYADDITFSFPSDEGSTVRYIIWMTQRIAGEEGYTLHRHKKLRVRRKHARQQVTGLVVNQAVNLPRPIRRWLRAVEHRLRNGKEATLSATQFAGWQALQLMIATSTT